MLPSVKRRPRDYVCHRSKRPTLTGDGKEQELLQMKFADYGYTKWCLQAETGLCGLVMERVKGCVGNCSLQRLAGELMFAPPKIPATHYVHLWWRFVEQGRISRSAEVGPAPNYELIGAPTAKAHRQTILFILQTGVSQEFNFSGYFFISSKLQFGKSNTAPWC